MLDAALAYARDGWPVFPLRRGRKIPATASGYLDATLDPERITAWWTSTPEANIGLATGAAGLVVIDVDAHDDGPDGWTSWCRLVTDHAPGGRLVDTFEVTTPSGGQHVFFVAPAGEPIKNSASKVGPGVDVRGDGGYVVAAPSRTDAGVYFMDRDHPVAPLPEWLDALLRPPRAVPQRPATPRTAPVVGHRDHYAIVALKSEAVAVSTAPIGTRNEKLNVAAFNLGQLVAAGKLDAGTVVAALSDAGLAAGLAASEIAGTVRSGLAAGMQEPRAVA